MSENLPQKNPIETVSDMMLALQDEIDSVKNSGQVSLGHLAWDLAVM